MGSEEKRIDVFVNEPDVYSGVDFTKYGCLGKCYLRGEESFVFSAVDALLVGLREVIDDSFLAPFSRLKYIVSNTTGIDHIRTRRQIDIIHLEADEIEAVSATAEFTLALLLSIARKIPFIAADCVSDRFTYRGVQLRGKRLGIFGMGRLGKKMARYAEALEMSWVGYDRGDGEEEKEHILESSDVITLHLPLCAETVGFISWREFQLMRRKPFLVNTARPQLVDKDALLDAVERAVIAGAAMDFINYDGSNTWDARLKEHMGEKLLLTPHIAGNTHESVEYTARIVVEKLMKRFVQETTPLGQHRGSIGDD